MKLVEILKDNPWLYYMSEEITKYITDENIKELAINKPCEIFTEDIYGNWVRYEDGKLTKEYLDDFTYQLANFKGIESSFNSDINLSVDFGVGNRVEIIRQNCLNKFSMTVRLNRGKLYSLEQLIKDEEIVINLKKLINNKRSILISGATNSGKTTLLNALIREIPDTERIVTVEGTPEIICEKVNWLPLCYDENSFKSESVKETLNRIFRVRPDRIILGEIRQTNAFVYNRAITSGHGNTMATIHANTPEEALNALIEYAIMNGDIGSDVYDITYNKLKRNIDVIIQAKRINNLIDYKVYFNDEVLQDAFY